MDHEKRLNLMTFVFMLLYTAIVSGTTIYFIKFLKIFGINIL